MKRFVVEGDAVDELVVLARLAERSATDDGVRAVVVPVDEVVTTVVHAFDGAVAS